MQVPFIQYKDPIWKLNSCPRGKFSRLIFSEEIKYALKFGYKIKIEYCYQFERGKDLFKDFVNDHYAIKKTSSDPVQRNISKLFLNSLYGRLGMNEIDEKMEIVDKELMEKLDKSYNVSIVSELDNNKYLVKYSNQIDDSIKKMYSDFTSLSDFSGIKKDEVKKLKLNKSRNISSAVHIAAAISSYARLLINEFKNIPNNSCVMSDTDSVVLTKPLPDKFVGKELGQLKLEHEVKEGIFIKKKLYYILDYNNQVLIKSSGLSSSELTYDSFKSLLKGDSITIKRTNFNLDWKTLNIGVADCETVVQGLKGKIKTIYNIYDVNFKYISFPIKYSIIVHPLFPLKDDKINLENIEYKNKYSILEVALALSFLSINLFILIILLYKIY